MFAELISDLSLAGFCLTVGYYFIAAAIADGGNKRHTNWPTTVRSLIVRLIGLVSGGFLLMLGTLIGIVSMLSNLDH